MASSKKKKGKKIEKSMRTKIIPILPDDLSSESQGDEKGGGVFLEEDIKIIYNALYKYKPSGGKKQRYELLLEQFEEILVCDYNTPPDAS